MAKLRVGVIGAGSWTVSSHLPNLIRRRDQGEVELVIVNRRDPVLLEKIRGKFGFAKKAALVGLSRGGLYCYNWAVANPDKVASLYGDAPVCDFKSWPGGKGKGKGSKSLYRQRNLIERMFARLKDFRRVATRYDKLAILLYLAMGWSGAMALGPISQTLPGFEFVNWFAIFGSRGLPPELTALWNKALRAAVAKPDVQKRFADNGMDTIIGSPEQLKATIVADRKKWSDVIQSAGIRAD